MYVPQKVVRVLLDHESSEMTAHYARITDQTVRRRGEQATKVNLKGERVDLDLEGPLAQAAWAKTRYGMATQTLPHSYCGLPIQKSCPHANACLTCPVFVTGPEFLPELREQRGRTLTLIDRAEVDGHTRIAQMNTEVLTNLDQMIEQFEHHEDDDRAVSRSWLYSQPDIRAQIDQLRARPASTASTPQRQRATDDSLRRRLEATTERMRQLEHDNRQLRQALAEALGAARERRVTGPTSPRDTPGKRAGKTIGPC